MMVSMLGCRKEDLPLVLQGLGYQRRQDGERELFSFRPKRARTRKKPAAGGQSPASASPFYALRHLGRQRS